jgi:hypothetical protein
LSPLFSAVVGVGIVVVFGIGIVAVSAALTSSWMVAEGGFVGGAIIVADDDDDDLVWGTSSDVNVATVPSRSISCTKKSEYRALTTAVNPEIEDDAKYSEMPRLFSIASNASFAVWLFASGCCCCFGCGSDDAVAVGVGAVGGCGLPATTTSSVLAVSVMMLIWIEIKKTCKIRFEMNE